MTKGYYRFPTINDDTVVFVCEDDLWTVPRTGGVARRLTANNGEVSWPVISADGKNLAFIGREEGQAEVYLMPAAGGPSRRLTFHGNIFCRTIGWTDDGKIIYGHSQGQPFSRMVYLYLLDPDDGSSELINIGPAQDISFGNDGKVVMGRNNRSPARWKRYRGGTAGQIWIDPTGSGDFNPLIELDGNLDSPNWIDDRIYFLSDHEGIGNIYSCLPSGDDLQRHTDHKDYYARKASSDGKRIVYHAGGNIYVFDPAQDQTNEIAITYHSSQTQRNRKFVPAGRNLDSWHLHPKGHSIAITSRGKPFTFGNWEGAVIQVNQDNPDRYRLLQWLNDGEKLIAVVDSDGEEKFVVISNTENGSIQQNFFEGLDIGRPLAIKINPHKDEILFSNHRQELFYLNLAEKNLVLVDKGKNFRIEGFNWSPDGEWAVYSVSITGQVAILKLWQRESGNTYPVTKAVLHDVEPSFDPQGKYIYFISYREFDPVYDNLQFDLNFPFGVRPYLITLQKETLSPFIPTLADETASKDKKNKNSNGDETKNEDDKKNSEQAVEPIQIDIEGIENRIIPFPVEEGRYHKILGTKDGKVIYSRFPAEGALSGDFYSNTPPAKGTLCMYDFQEQKEKTLVNRISNFDLNLTGTTLIYRAGNRLRVLPAGKSPDKNGPEPGKESGWIDLNRVKVSVIPAQEWKQMYRETWRLQKEQFWTENMSNINWLTVYERYLPLLERVASRSEFSDLTWEMQGELGTSHAYEFGGDYRPEPQYQQGYLGADFEYDDSSKKWVIKNIVVGDVWDDKAGSPLAKPGLNVQINDRILAINGRSLDKELSPAKALVNLANQEISLTIEAPAPEGENGLHPTRSITVKTLSDETALRYREWVEKNRSHVHEATNGTIGYIHIPDMGPHGYAEFHRSYLSEIDRTGLIVDVRHNGGGHVSSLILEKLARRKLGFVISRWQQIPRPYPAETVLGPMIALTNEHAGSDGDIFSHSFKMMGLGPLVGKRTWGGVIGIYPRHSLVDGTITTQPEFSFWFHDVGWGVENYGTDPDIEIDNRPQDYAAGFDAQLEKTIEEIQRILSENPPIIPEFDNRPDLKLPILPDRKNE